MVELSSERVEEILHKETMKTEELTTILRGVYTRYMHLFEKYFADIDALNDEVISKLKEYHEETKSLIKYYYLDIPLDICMGLKEFDEKYCAILLGPDWHKILFDDYKEFKAEKKSGNKSEECIKKEYSEQGISAFYDVMDYIFRDDFGTSSKTTESVASGIAGMLFGE